MTALARIGGVARVPGFLVLSGTALALGLATSLAIPYLSLFAATEAHLSPRQLGVYLVVSALANVPVAAWLGRLSDRRGGRKRALVLSLAGGTAGYLAMSRLRSFPALLLDSVLLLSLGRAAFAQIFALARARFDAGEVEDLTLATSTMRMFFSVAWVLGPALGAALLTRMSFTGFYQVVGAMYALVTLLVLPLDAPDGSGGSARARTTVLAYLRLPSVATTTAGFALVFLCSSLHMIVLPLHVVETLHGDERQVGWLLGLAASLEIPLMLASGLGAGRLGKARLIVCGAALYAAYFAWLALARQPWQLYPAQLLNAAVVSVVMGLGMSHFQDQLPGEPGASTALYANAMTLGSVLSGVLFAALGATGTRGMLVACAACALGAAGLLARRDWRALSQ
jgi:SET family sugar efflux transporter-like MFS transporter